MAHRSAEVAVTVTRLRAAWLVLGLLCAANAQAQAPVDYAAAKRAADGDEATLSIADAAPHRDAQQRVLEAAVTTCATPTADTTPFVVVAELEAGGRVARTWREGSTPLAICVQKQINAATLRAPPRAPFFTSFELSFTR